MKNISAIIVLLLSFNALAQYQIPGGGSIAMPPGCEAQFYLANYCVASNIVPINLSLFASESEISAIAKNPEGYQCIRASYSWQNCSRYLKSIVEKRITSQCKDYWNNPFLKDASAGNGAAHQQLMILNAECGGVHY